MNDALNFRTDQLEKLFPFHILFDEDLIVIRFGKSLAKVIAEIAPGKNLADLLILERPERELTAEVFKSNGHGNVLYLFLNPSNRCLLRGEVLELDNGCFVFIGSPWLTTPAQLGEFGLSIGDFAVYDPIVDLLQMVQSQKIALNDLQKLANTLKKQRQELREQEREARKLALIASRTDNAVILTNAQGEIEWVNEGFTRITEYTLEEVVGRKPGEFLQGPESQPQVVDRMRHHLHKGEAFREELINYTKSGFPYWVHIEVQPIHDKNGQLTHFMAIEADITKEKEAAQQLQREKDLLELTLASISEAVLTTTSDGRIELMNQAAANLFGVTSKVAIGCPVLDFMRLSTLQGVPIENIFEISDDADEETVTGNVFDLHQAVMMTNHLGMNRKVTYQIKPMEPGSENKSRLLLVLRDVDEELEIERMKTDFVSSVSHELRTPLTSIKGFVATILKDPEMPADVRAQFLNIVHDQSNRLQDLVDDLLEISRLESGKIPFNFEVVETATILRQAIREFEISAGKAGVELRLNMPGTLPNLYGDRSKFRSVLTNLISNAIKFTPEGGSVGVQVDQDADSLQIIVSDTGMGIPEKDRERIFQKFFRVNRPGVEIQGTGLGLAIVKAIVENFGGSIRLKSKVGEGTTFHLEFPLCQEDPSGTSSELDDSSGD